MFGSRLSRSLRSCWRRYDWECGSHAFSAVPAGNAALAEHVQFNLAKQVVIDICVLIISNSSSPDVVCKSVGYINDGPQLQSAAEEEAVLKNPAAILYGADDLRYMDHPLPDVIAPGHVRIQMRAVGICGSDVHFYKKVCGWTLMLLEDFPYM